MPLKRLTQPQITRALVRLGELAKKEGILLEMTLYGGAAMMLAFDARQSTKDVDAIVHPKEVSDRLARQVAREQELHDDWLNADVHQFVSGRETKHPLQIHDLQNEGLTITRPTTNYMIAMKAMACRLPLPGYAGDLDDLKFLLKKAQIHSVERVQQIVDKYFPDSPLPATTRRQLSAILKTHREHAESEKVGSPANRVGSRQSL